MAEPVELTKKVKAYLKANWPELDYVEYVGTFNGKPAYAVSDIPFEQHAYTVQGGYPFFVAEEHDLTKSLFYHYLDEEFRAGFKGDPDYVPKPDPLAEPLEVTEKVQALLKDRYPGIRYLGRIDGLPVYELSKKEFIPENYMFGFEDCNDYYLANPDDLSKSKFFKFMDELYRKIEFSFS